MKLFNPNIPHPWSTIIISLAIFLSASYLTFDFVSMPNDYVIGDTWYELTTKSAKTKNTIPQDNNIPTVSAKEIDLDNISEFSAEELKYLDGINHEPEVKYLRTAINKYLTNGERDESEVVTSDIANCGLEKFKKYLDGKFVAYQMSPGKYGGQIVDIIFRDKPDKIFETWVYRLAGGEYDLRGFCVKPLSNNATQVVIKAFGGLLRNNKIAL